MKKISDYNGGLYISDPITVGDVERLAKSEGGLLSTASVLKNAAGEYVTDAGRLDDIYKMPFFEWREIAAAVNSIIEESNKKK